MKENKSKNFDWTLIGFLIIISIGLLWLEFNTNTNPLHPQTIFIIRALQLIASIAVGFFIQRIQSKEEFQADLKNFALSAYRRIVDIEKIANRLLVVTNNAKQKVDRDETSDIDVIKEIALSIKYTVSSSNADWVDIIGEELKKKERINELQTQKALLTIETQKAASPQNGTEKQLNQIRTELSNLRSELPLILQDSNQENYYGGPFEPKYSGVIDRHFIDMIETTGYIYLSIELDTENCGDFLLGKNPYTFGIDSGMGQHHLVIRENEGIWGEIINPFENSIDRNDFTVTLFEILADISEYQNDKPADISGSPIAVINNIEYVKKSDFNSKIFIIRIPVTLDMITKG